MGAGINLILPVMFISLLPVAPDHPALTRPPPLPNCLPTGVEKAKSCAAIVVLDADPVELISCPKTGGRLRPVSRQSGTVVSVSWGWVGVGLVEVWLL